MYRNEYMKKRLKALDKAASEAPKVSLEEALAQYDRHEKWAAQASQNGRVPRKSGGRTKQ
jgi:predicted transcriptional regulator